MDDLDRSTRLRSNRRFRHTPVDLQGLRLSQALASQERSASGQARPCPSRRSLPRGPLPRARPARQS
jgi:hypothetical protein